MKIVDLTFPYLNDLIDFNKKIYPRRKGIEKRFNNYFLTNPFSKRTSQLNGLIALEEKEGIIGQILFIPFEFNYSGKVESGYWAYDYFVLEKYRKTGLGAFLAMDAVKKYTPFFAIGANENAIKIWLKLKNKIIGYSHKYIYFRNIFQPVKLMYGRYINKAFSPRDKIYDFPEKIIIKEHTFSLIKSIEKWTNAWHNPEIIEFSRSLNFLEWRFLSFQKNIRKYQFYLLDNGNTQAYFVVRHAFWNGLNLLLIVDYRTSISETTCFNLIVKSTKKLLKIMGFDGVLITSSLSQYDIILKKHFFIKVGTPQNIITNSNIIFDENNIEKRNFVFATMADSDGDFNFGGGIW